MRDEKGRFVRGHTGYNPELKGCFQKGHSQWNKIRTEKYKRPCMKYKGKMVLVSHYIWCTQPENLPFVPKGFIIHHRDLNPFNNEPSNLMMLPRDYHNQVHSEYIKQLMAIKPKEVVL